MKRRRFLRSAAAATAAGAALSARRRSVAAAGPNSTPNLALIGVGGRGEWFVKSLPGMGTRFAAFCDVHGSRLEKAGREHPEAKRFADYREMLESMHGALDGVVVAVPDHSHAPACAHAMKLGLPVFCEKPLTRTIEEARYLRDLTRETGLATQMGNQGTSSDAFLRSVEIIRSGALGTVREVIAWNASGGPGQRALPGIGEPTPPYLSWDLWLGPREDRPFHPQWLNWHSWRDFGTGNLGNWAVHSANLAFKAFQVGHLWDDTAPDADFPAGRNLRVTARASEIVGATFPKWEQVDYEVPERAGLPPMQMSWVNGDAPGSRERIESLLGRKLDWGDAGERKWHDHAGLVIAGSDGLLNTTGHNMSFEMHPKERFADLMGPPREFERSPGHEREWLNAIAGGPKACSDFAEYGSLLTEFVLLGNVATQFEETLTYDPVTSRFPENPAADSLRLAGYREGWMLG